MKARLRVLTDHQALVWRLHEEEGLKYREIAEGLGLSQGAVHRLVAAARKRLAAYEANPREGFAVLPVRTQKALDYLEFKSRSEVMEAVKSGLLYYDEREGRGFYERKTGRWIERQTPGTNFAHLRSAGWESWAAVLEWLDLPVPPKRGSGKK